MGISFEELGKKGKITFEDGSVAGAKSEPLISAPDRIESTAPSENKPITFEELSGKGEVTFQDDSTFIQDIKDIGGQAIAGLEDVVDIAAEPLDRTFGTAVWTDDGIKFLSPDEASTARDAGLIKLPGAIDRDPSNIIEAGARFAGETFGAGPIIGKLAGAISTPIPAATRLGRLGQFPKKLLAETGEVFAKSPGKFTATETALGFSAGSGGFSANIIFPESALAKFFGEIIGATAPSVLGSSIIANAGRRIWALVSSITGKAKGPLTPSGAKKRAVERFQRATKPEAPISIVDELEGPVTIDSATGEPILSPGQRSGNEGLMALEQDILVTSEELTHINNQSLAKANEVLQSRLVEVGGSGSFVDTETFVRNSNEYFNSLMSARVEQAAEKIKDRISDLGSKATPEQINIAADEEIRAAMKSLRAQEKELFDLIPEETPTPFGSGQSTYAIWKRKLAAAQQDSLPVAANTFLNPKSSKFLGKAKKTKGSFLETGSKKPELSKITALKEVRGVQSKLRQEARNARAIGPKQNLLKAKIADEIAESLGGDIIAIEASEEAAAAVKIAVNFSSNANAIRKEAILSKITGKKGTGARIVPPGLVLEESLGLSDVRSREGLSQILKLFDRQPSATGIASPSSEKLRNIAEDYIELRFAKKAMETGTFNLRSAERFMNANEELLSKLPAAKAKMEQVIQDGNVLAIRQAQQKRFDFKSPAISKATLIIQKGPIEAFKQINKMRPAAALKEVRGLIARAGRDQTGEAMAGLKQGYSEFLISAGRLKTRDVAGQPVLSGFAMKDALDASKSWIHKLFSSEDLKNINLLINDLIKLEKGRAAKPSKEGVLGDLPGKVLERTAGFSGAKVGSIINEVTPGPANIQTPGFTASMARDFLKAHIKDPGTKLIIDAMGDPLLLKEYLLSTIDPATKEITREAKARLNIWFTLTMAEYGGVFDDETKEQ